MEENKNREERTEQGTKQTKEDIIIEKLDKVQVQNGIIMSAIGSIIIVMLDKRDKLDLNVIQKVSLHNCLKSISLSLTDVQKDVGMCIEEEMKQRDKEVGDILDMILDLLK